MSKKSKEEWYKKHPKGKAFLAWNLADYLAHDLEPTPAVVEGKTEGMIMEEEEIVDWAKEEMQCLYVFRESYPYKFDEQVHKFILDLEYLHSLDKITKEELDKLSDRENFNFGQNE